MSEYIHETHQEHCPLCKSVMVPEGQSFYCNVCKRSADDIWNEIENEEFFEVPEVDDTVI